MDFSNIIGSVGAVAGGGIFGLAGSVFGNIAKYWQTKQDRKFELEKFKHEQKLLELNMQAKKEETESEIAIASNAGSWQGLNESIKADALLKPISPWAVDCKALFRPFLTIILWILATWVFYRVIIGTQNKIFTEFEAKELVKYMVHSVFFSASTATVWWFGDRSFAKNKK